MKTFQQLLNEMPYFEIEGNRAIFDLELEKFVKSHDKKGCINFINTILSGQVFKDKYGDILQLQTLDEKEQFKKILLNNYQFNKIMQQLGISAHKLFQVPIATFKQYHENAMVAASGGAFGTFSGQYAAGDARVPKILGTIQRRPRIPTLFKKKKKKKKRVIKESLTDSIETFLSELTPNDTGKEQFGDFIVYFEGFNDVCKQDLDARLQLPLGHPRKLEAPNDIEKEILDQWSQEMGSTPIRDGWFTDEIFYAIFKKPNIESFRQFDEATKFTRSGWISPTGNFISVPSNSLRSGHADVIQKLLNLDPELGNPEPEEFSTYAITKLGWVRTAKSDDDILYYNGFPNNSQKRELKNISIENNLELQADNSWYR